MSSVTTAVEDLSKIKKTVMQGHRKGMFSATQLNGEN
jgi:hypothetical protein